MSDMKELLELLRSTQDDLEQIASRVDDHIDELERLIDEFEEREADLVAEKEELEAAEVHEVVVIDATGKIMIEGHIVGWVNKAAYQPMVDILSKLLRCHMPPLQDMRSIAQGEAK